MQFCVALITLAMASVALAGPKCGGKGGTVRQFRQRTEDTKMPCKYHAVRQTCGDYLITLTPGNVYLHPKYRLDSLWLEVTDAKTGKFWQGRTDNKIAVKYYNGWTSSLFNKKGGDLDTDSVLKFSNDSKQTLTEAKNGDFVITFRPWDPESKKFRTSKWSFECQSKSFVPEGYPRQICGGIDQQEVADRYKELGLEKRYQAVYYDVFTNTGIAQTNQKCAKATRIMSKKCTEKQRREAMITCTQILASYKHTKCVTKYSCDPMDVFVDCLEWVCSDFKDRNACERVGSGIDMCRPFRHGDLTKKVEKANCYKDYLPIEN